MIIHSILCSIISKLPVVKAVELTAESVSYVNSLMEISIKGNRVLLLWEEKNAVKLCSEHKSIFEAIKQKNPALARERMNRHIQRVRILYQENLQ